MEPNQDNDRVHAVVLSADTPAGLRSYARRLREHLDRTPGIDPADIAYTSQTGRVAMSHRLALLVPDLTRLRSALDAYLADRPHPCLHRGQTESGAAAGASTAGTEAEAVADWLAGAEVPWRRYWSEPARRIPLPVRDWDDEPDEQAPAPSPDAARTSAAVERPAPAAPPGSDEVPEAALRYVLELYGEVSGIPVDRLDPRVPLADYGIGSFLITSLNARLERDLGERDRTLFLAHGDLAGVARALAHRHPRLAERGEQRAAAPVEPDADRGAVAVIGIAGRYPKAADLRQLWDNLVHGRDCVTRLPEDRRRPGWPVDLMWGGFLDGVDLFDPLLFAISPRDAELMDPQERIFLEVVWELLEDAGYPPARLRSEHGSRVGVYAGAMYNEYPYFGVERSQRGHPQDSGATLGGVANRVSFAFDLRGPSLTVDTMCSSSLVAIHLAVRALRDGEVDLAIAGAVNLSLHPNKFIQQERMRLTASGHRCRSFGAGGDGFVPSEGAGAVLLKPLDRALADGDRVHAVIRGTSVVHAGRTNGYLVPNPAAQGEMVAKALRDAGVPPETIGYVEAHGAGTALGDPVEVEGLTSVFGPTGLAPGAIPIGSVKSVLGHVEAAAGMAGLTKVVLQLRHATLAPSLHADELNPNVRWDEVPFRVQREAAAWPPARWPRRAGISSFGAGGTITHVVVEQAPPEPERPAPAGGEQLVVLSAHDADRLAELAGRVVAALERDDPPALDDIAFTLQAGREALRERLAAVVRDRAEFRDRLRRFLAGEAGAVVRGRAPSAGHAAGPALPTPGAEVDLTALARHWVEGGAVDWARLRDPRRAPRVVELPSYPFARVRCWLPEPEGSAPTPAPTPAPAPLPAPPDTGAGEEEVPLHRWTWAPVGPVAAPTTPTAPLLCVFSEHSEPVARALADRLGRDRVLLVREGGELADGIPGYTGAAEAAELVGALLDAHPALAGWLDLADLHLPDAEHGLWRARLAALQRVVGRKARTGLRVVQVTCGLQDLDGPRPTLAGARMASFVRVLGSEHRGVRACALDTDRGPHQVRPLVEELLAEWAADAPFGEVCHRGGVRHRPVLEPLEAAHAPLAVDPDAAHLVTGGTRGLGALVARWLVERGARRLVLCGTRPPADELLTWLRDRGVRVLTHLADLADRPRLRELLDAVRSELGPIGGVVHCAGRFTRGRPSFANLDPTAMREVLGPKADGLDALLDLLDGRPPRFVVLFSSVCVAVPSLAAGTTDYAAANAYLDFVAAHRTRTGQPRFHAVDWPQWTQTGGTSSGPNPCAALGIGGLTDRAGLRVLERVLTLPGGGRVLPAPALGGGIDPEALVRPHPDPTPPEVADTMPGPAATPAQPARWLVRIFADALHIPVDDLDVTAEFGALGVESIMIGELVRAIEDRLGRPLEPAALLEHPTLERLADHLGQHEPEPGPEQAASAPAPEPTTGGPVERADRHAADHRIAVIGVACRFPGATDVDAFWANLVAGRSSVVEVPPSRWDHTRWYRAERTPGASTSKWGGFVDGIEDFDPEHFGLGEDEARCLDPSIRLFLEATAACLREAGYADDELAGRDVGVFVGARMTDSYARRAGLRPNALRSDQNFIAAHVAQHFDFGGPNMVVDSACSSSLVSVQLACRSLLDGESEVALAGGVEVLLDEQPYLELSAARVLSPSGRCQVFDERADGFVPGEGCGVVLLKPLAAALADGDRVHAVIEGVAVNNDGRTMGITTPNPRAQTRLVRRALALAGRAPEEIGLVEAHGTGTTIGDPIELRALTDVFAEGADRTGWCAIGSVKSNIGHLLSAAGVAGLIKVVLSLEHGLIPPTLWCERPNPRFDFARSPFFPNLGARPWQRPGPERVACLSSFGLGGTNAHLVASGPDPRWSRAARQPLPPPPLRRRRLWLDRPQEGHAAPATSPDEPLVASTLDLQLTVNRTPAPTASTH
ncbi:acyl transferase domain-containing protein/acyl carrier protein [Saccharothrix coeruleofusca]|uniref:SDR family NAD(P)-dependent oxidoreductase n=1 Tax=Saccharothrix coeruleofusca TaxID=33919 RepID=UPI001AE6DA1A|nr:SDR family NAD(P)-dependent oxidoreductase [Saccharothrix coeruleofusca]MBP2336642.1 acyl transferase domain-containing protein/acyl carrier protein [Saccharothrix coeruleofusca]